MIIEELILENFLSFQEAELNLKDRGLLLISGSNGSGKSSLTSKALSWALFGQTPSGLKGDSVCTIGTKNTSSVCLFIRDYLNSAGFLKRQRNPNLLSVNGLEYKVSSDTQEHINKLFGKDFKTFLNADYFGQDRQLRLLEQTSKFQLEILEEVLHLDRLDTYIEKASSNIKDLEYEFTSLNDKVNVLSGTLSALYNEHLKLKTKLASKQSEITCFLSQKKDNFNASSLIKQRDQLLETIKIVEKNLEDNNSHLSTTIKSKYSLENQIQNLKNKIQKVEDAICPTCSQTTNRELTDRLKNIQVQIQEDLLKLHEELKIELEKLKSLEIKKESLQANQKQIYNLLLEINNNLLRESEIKRVDLQIKDIEDLIRDIDKKLKIKNEELEITHKQKTEAEKLLKVYKFWKSAFSKDFKNFIIQQSLPYIEERTNHHLRLLNNPQIEVKFSSSKELKSGEERAEISITASVNQGGASYSALSGGEKQIASFAVGLALSEISDLGSGKSSNVIILDEPFTELDNKNCENVVLYLQNELVKRKPTILLISNDDRMKSLISNVVEIYKDENGISHINERNN